MNCKNSKTLEVYSSPNVKITNLPNNLELLKNFSGQFVPDEVDLDGMEGDEFDNL